MRAIKRINNNVAVCVDGAGNECLAMGRGIGFGAMPRELTLDEVERTFYDIDERYYSAINDLPVDVLDFSVRCCDYARTALPYAVSPNLVITLADHLAFALQRTERNISLRMPLAHEVEQTYPLEYRVGLHILAEAKRTFKLGLLADEAAAIALDLTNARIDAPTPQERSRQQAEDVMLEDVTSIVERRFDLRVDRTSFAFSRYVTHMRYLFERLRTDAALDPASVIGMQGMAERYPLQYACVEEIVRHIENTWPNTAVTEDERLYLLIHVSRICISH